LSYRSSISSSSSSSSSSAAVGASSPAADHHTTMPARAALQDTCTARFRLRQLRVAVLVHIKY